VLARDLAAASGHLHSTADVCVVGSGPVGLAVARRLAERGVRVALLERGGRAPVSEDGDPGVAFDAGPYGGAGVGRAFGLGGTSALWGGQLLPQRASEFEGGFGAQRPHWLVDHHELEPHYRTLDRWLGVAEGPFELAAHPAHPLAALNWDGWSPRLSKWLPFRRRNIAAAWSGALARAGHVEAWLNARVTDFELDPAGRRVVAAIAQAGGAQLRVAARRTVLAAGTIESTSLLLALFARPALAGRASPTLGHYLQDHLSMRVAQLEVRDPAAFRQLFEPRFVRGTLRTVRLEPAPQFLRAAGLPPSYAHLVAEVGEGSGFGVLRDLLRASQRRDASGVWSALRRVPRTAPGLARLALTRLVRNRLAYPAGAGFWLHVDFEQPVDASRRIYRGPAAGAAGSTVLRVDWRPDADAVAVAVAEGYRRHLGEFWARNGLDRLARLDFGRGRATGDCSIRNIYDIYHPAGTTRIGDDAGSGCVDRHLAVHSLHDLYVVGASVFPALGAANPTYTAMALGLRLADHLGRPGAAP